MFILLGFFIILYEGILKVQKHYFLSRMKISSFFCVVLVVVVVVVVVH